MDTDSEILEHKLEERVEDDPNTNIYLKYKNAPPHWLEHTQKTIQFMSNYSKIKVSKDIEYIGNEGNYQYYIFYIFALTFLIMGFLSTIITYTYYSPEFFCIADNGSNYKCTQKEACELGKFDIVKSRTSLITEFDMYCGTDKILVTITQTYIFTLAAIITFIIAIISDKIGRRNCFFIMIGFLLVGGVISIFGNSIWSISTGVLLTWTSTDIFYSMALIYFNEITSDYLRSKVSIFFIIAAVGAISINFILLFIPDFKNYYLFCFICCFLFSFLFFRFVPSPFFVFSTGNFKNYHDSLLEIGTRNGKDSEELKQEFRTRYQLSNIIEEKNMSEVEILKVDVKKENLYQRTQNTFGLIFSRQYSFTIFLCLIFYCNNYITESIGLIAPQKLGIENIYIIRTLLSIADLLGYLIVIPISHTIKRRYLNIGCNIIFLSISILLMINEFNKKNDSYKVLATTLSCVFKMANSAMFSLSFNYISELFPTKIRGLTTGLIVCAGRLSNSFASTIDHFSTIYDIHPLILTALPTLFSIPASYFLPETAEKNLIN